MLTVDDRKWLMNTWTSLECPKCDNRKGFKYFLCRWCWGQLPNDLKADILYAFKRHGIVSEEFSEALDDAIKFAA